jgi:hypothetical protein
LFTGSRTRIESDAEKSAEYPLARSLLPALDVRPATTPINQDYSSHLHHGALLDLRAT